MASVDNQVTRFLNYQLGNQSREKKRLTNKEIINVIEEIPQEFEERCEKIRLGALGGKNKYHAPRTLVLDTYLFYSRKLKELEIYGSDRKTLKKKLEKIAKIAKEKVEKTYKKYCPPYSEEPGPLAVKFVPPPIPTNKGKYDGTGHPKVETQLDFERAPFADPEFIEQHRRKDPCNCTIL